MSGLSLTPTRAGAEAALNLLKEDLLTEFPFVSDVDRAVALSGMLTTVVRGAMSVAPLHGINARSPGTGKSYLLHVISGIATGQECPVSSVSVDPNETEKRLVGLLLDGYPVISLDNCNGELTGDLLCQAVEQPSMKVRKLGASDQIRIENGQTIFATGNSLRLAGDMVRRSLVCTMDAGVERPEMRQFKSNPVAEVMANRGKYVVACLTIALAYRHAGRPELLSPLGSFADWSGLVRSALVWLGEADPCASQEAAREDDPVLCTLREMLEVWRSAVGTGLEWATTARHVIETANAKVQSTMGTTNDYTNPDLREAMLGVAGTGGNVNSKRLGKWLAAHEGRIVGGLKFTRHPTHDRNGLVRWAVVTATSPAAQPA